MVWPTISGITIDARDHVLIGLRSRRAFIATIFSRRLGWTKGPFFSDLDIDYLFFAGRITKRSVWRLRRVFLPMAGLPQRVFGLDMPIGARASPGLELDAVDLRADGDVLDRQAVAGARLRLGTGEERVADLDPVRSEDVALLAVAVRQQREARRTVRVVLERDDARRHAVLVALEVDDPVVALLAAAAVARRDLALHVPSGATLFRLDEPSFRPLLREAREIGCLSEAQPRGGRLETLQRHVLHTLHEEALDLLTLGELHDRLASIGTPSDLAADAPQLARDAHDAHLQHVHLERGLHRILDLMLVRA